MASINDSKEIDSDTEIILEDNGEIETVTSFEDMTATISGDITHTSMLSKELKGKHSKFYESPIFFEVLGSDMFKENDDLSELIDATQFHQEYEISWRMKNEYKRQSMIIINAIRRIVTKDVNSVLLAYSYDVETEKLKFSPRILYWQNNVLLYITVSAELPVVNVRIQDSNWVSKQMHCCVKLYNRIYSVFKREKNKMRKTVFQLFKNLKDLASGDINGTSEVIIRSELFTLIFWVFRNSKCNKELVKFMEKYEIDYVMRDHVPIKFMVPLFMIERYSDTSTYDIYSQSIKMLLDIEDIPIDLINSEIDYLLKDI